MKALEKYKIRSLRNLKNLPGWKTKRKLVVFSFDDYGNIRMASKGARDYLKTKGLSIESNRFDLYDSLETAEDLEALYDILKSVRDQNGNNAKVTAFTNVANINFEAIEKNGFQKYEYETILDSYQKMASDNSPWEVLKQGIQDKLILPQSHGREHINLKFFNKLLSEKNSELVACINKRSFGGFTTNPFKHISYTSAFSFEDTINLSEQEEILGSGLVLFEKIFGFKAKHFNGPGSHEHHLLEPKMNVEGIKYIDNDIIKREHQGRGVYSSRINFNGSVNRLGQRYFVRNGVFEPILYPTNCVERCIRDIEVAFRYKNPANISSHRVNFSGTIEPKIRSKSLSEFRKLLKTILRKWPDVEFVSSVRLGKIMEKKA